MKTIKTYKDYIKNLNFLVKLQQESWRINKKQKDQLRRAGFCEVDLGTGPRQYIKSLEISIIDISKTTNAQEDSNKLLCIGIANRLISKRDGGTCVVYRAWVKALSPKSAKAQAITLALTKRKGVESDL